MAPPKTIDYFQKERQKKTTALAGDIHSIQTQNIACFYGSLLPTTDVQDIDRIMQKMNEYYEHIERDFDLQRINKYKARFTVYLSHTGLFYPQDLPKNIRSATNEHFMIISTPLPPFQSILKEMAHSLLHIPYFSVQESISQYIAHTFEPLPPHRLLPPPEKAGFSCASLPPPPLFWAFLAQNFNGNKTVGDLADCGELRGALLTPQPDLLFDIVAQHLKTDASELKVKWSAFLTAWSDSSVQ
jgi:hypothetical protein